MINAQIMVISMLMLEMPKSFAAMQDCEENSPDWELTPACEEVIDTAIHKRADKAVGEKFMIGVGVQRCLQQGTRTVLKISSPLFWVADGYLPDTGANGSVIIKGNSCEIISLKVYKPKN